jgi:protein TonB
VATHDRRLWLAVGISVLFHALLLTVHFKFPDASKAFREKAMDIILVNAKSASKPHDAQALAQSNLMAGAMLMKTGAPRHPCRPPNIKTMVMPSSKCSVGYRSWKRHSNAC